MTDESPVAEKAAVEVPTSLMGWMLRPTAHPNFRRAAVAYLVGEMAYTYGKAAYAKYNNLRRYTIAISGEDEIFQEVTNALYSIMPPVDYRSVEARSYRLKQAPREVPYDEPEVAPNESSSRVARALQVIGDRELEQPVVIDGHKIRVKFTKERYLTLSEAKQRGTGVQDKRIELTAPSAEARDAVIAWLSNLAQVTTDEKPRLYIATRWGGWDRRNDLPTRKLDTVILRDGMRSAIIADLERFFADEEAYAKLGLPWHRGYLLHGPGGTGKTSIARGLADYFGMDVYYLPLSDMESDTNLMGLVSAIKPRSMLLLEDIDTAHVATDREEADTEYSASMSGLLNSLDGVSTPHGLVTVMTTNHLDRLDETLIRPGRADLKLEISYVDREQINRLFELVYGEKVNSTTKSFRDGAITRAKITPAQVVEICKTHLDKKMSAEFALLNLIETRLEAKVPV